MNNNSKNAKGSKNRDKLKVFDDSTRPKGFWEHLKDYIALSIVFFSFVFLITLIILAFGHLNSPTEFQNMKDILGIMLPIIGTWMGTILAFYFSKDNFELANRSMQETMSKLTPEEKLKSIPVKDVMIVVDNIKHPFKDNPPEKVTLKDLLKYSNDKELNRIVVLDKDKKVSRVIHKSIINDFIADQMLNKNEKKEIVENYTIDDMLSKASPEIKEFLEKGVECINIDANLLDAQQKIIINKKCQDVFVTTSGDKNEPIIGWLTNVIITDNAKV